MPRRTADDAAQTRDDVLAAALAVFAERGFAATQLEDVAKRAGVTRGALYHHFADKAALYLAVLEERWGQVMAPIMAVLQRKARPEQRLRAFLESYLVAMRDDPQARALMTLSLSADSRLPALRDHGAKVTALDGLTAALAGVLAEHGKKRPRARALALVVVLNGIAVSSMIYPAALAGDAAALVGLLADGALR